MSDGADPPGAPAHPALARVARELERRGFAAEVWDAQWRLAYLSSEYRALVNAGRSGGEDAGLGAHVLSEEMVLAREGWPTGPTFESFRDALGGWGRYVAGSTAGGVEALLRVADPRLHEAIRARPPERPPAAWSVRVDVRFGGRVLGNDVLVLVVAGDDGERAGYLALAKPEVRATVLGMLAVGDAAVFERISRIVQPARRPGAILFADLESSTALARRLPTPAYFAVIRRLAAGGDRAVVDAGGIVGKHVGDGITGFFLADDLGSEAGAAAACLAAMRGIRAAALRVASRSDLGERDVTVRFGLHWGGTLYVGRLMTSGRVEIAALGEEVNEAARIEACASGGAALASKALIERLDAAGAQRLGLDLAGLVYTPLGELPTATEKARRDAPAISVCAL